MRKKAVVVRVLVAVVLVIPVLPAVWIQEGITKTQAKWFQDWIDYLEPQLPR